MLSGLGSNKVCYLLYQQINIFSKPTNQYILLNWDWEIFIIYDYREGNQYVDYQTNFGVFLHSSSLNRGASTKFYKNVIGISMFYWFRVFQFHFCVYKKNSKKTIN